MVSNIHFSAEYSIIKFPAISQPAVFISNYRFNDRTAVTGIYNIPAMDPPCTYQHTEV
jgi:hypothetical protein